jgi:hypothetical protein
MSERTAQELADIEGVRFVSRRIVRELEHHELGGCPVEIAVMGLIDAAVVVIGTRSGVPKVQALERLAKTIEAVRAEEARNVQ